MIRTIVIALAIGMAAPALAVYGGGDRTEANAGAIAGAEADAYGKGVGIGHGGDGYGKGIGYGGDGGEGGEGGQGGSATGGQGYGYGGQAISGPSSSNSGAGAAAQNGSQSLTNVYQNHYQYRAPFMDSNTLLLNSAACKTFLGVQFSQANADGAGGMGLGIPLDDKDCKLDKATRLAWAGGNTKLGWELFCSQPSLITNRAHVLKLQGVQGRTVRRQRAYADCMTGAVDWKATLSSIQVEIDELTALLVEVAERPGYDDAKLRARLRLLESAAHRPRTTELLIEKQEE